MQSELSRIVDLQTLGRSEAVFDIEASRAERAALAERFGIEAIDRLAARVSLRRIGRSEVLLDAEIRADIVQTCVHTLEPVANRIEDRIALRFGPPADSPDSPRLAVFAADDDFEPLPEGPFDIGEILAGELSLLLDPYPRGAAAADPREEAGSRPIQEQRPESPFHALAGLRRKD